MEKSWHLPSTFPNTALVYPKQPEGEWESKALHGLTRNSGPAIHAQKHTWFQDGCQALAFSSGGGAGIWQRPADIS